MQDVRIVFRLFANRYITVQSCREWRPAFFGAPPTEPVTESPGEHDRCIRCVERGAAVCHSVRRSHVGCGVGARLIHMSSAKPSSSAEDVAGIDVPEKGSVMYF